MKTIAFVAAIFIVFAAIPIMSTLWQEHEVAKLSSMISSGNSEQVFYFITRHPQYIECDMMDGRKRTPLSFAANIGQYTICSNLIAAGANINSTDNADLTPLDWALKMSRTNIVELLIQHGADVTITAQDGKNASDFAADTTSSYLQTLLSNAMFSATNRTKLIH